MVKGQFKIQQMAFMLLALLLFFILVALFFIAFQSSGLKEQANAAKEEQAILMTQFLSGASEFSCPDKESYCIDTDKLIILQGKKEYEELWPVSYIEVRRLDKGEEECSKANYPDCNIYKVYENKKIQYKGSGAGNFVALCRYEKVSEYPTRVCELGKLIIGYDVS